MLNMQGWSVSDPREGGGVGVGPGGSIGGGGGGGGGGGRGIEAEKGVGTLCQFAAMLIID